MKKEIFALYLPQYHEIPENNEWWGKGYTEWNAVKKAIPYYKNHNQPRIPLNENYYDLSDTTGEVWKWQAKLASEYSIDGFAIYHYWFKDGKKLLEKPMEILLAHNEIDIQYFACWANEPWKRTWYQGDGQETLMPQDYGQEEEWKEHYEYLRQFFLDSRYKKIDNCPVIGIYRTSDIEDLPDMKKVWDSLARDDGFDGVYILGAKTAMEQETRYGIIDGEYMFEPSYTLHYQYNMFLNCRRAVRRIKQLFKSRVLKKNVVLHIEKMRELYRCLEMPKDSVANDIFYGICPAWDNTPRKQTNGCVFDDASPELFGVKLRELIDSKMGGNLIIINAWNEWGEGAYLEPDTANRYRYLEEIKAAVNKGK